MLAGPNGAGKSTFYEAYLSHLPLPFLNADLLARETGLDAYAAAREIGAIRDYFVQRKCGFISETVLSDPIGDKVAFLSSAVREGFDVELIFIGIETVGLAEQRVLDRVGAGGHDVPREKLRARYPRTLENLKRAIQQLPLVTIYDNSDDENPYQFVAEFRGGKLLRHRKPPFPAWVQEFCPKGAAE